MTTLFQFAVFAFIVFSLLLMVGVPVVFASSYPEGEGWNESKNKTTLFSGIGVWFFLVFLIGILNSFVV